MIGTLADNYTKLQYKECNFIVAKAMLWPFI